MGDSVAKEGKPGSIFLLCGVFALHMVEEFTLGFVEWADRYFGNFDWTQNLIGNSGYMVMLAAACFFYYRNPEKRLWLGMTGPMWVLSNAFIHLSATLLGGEYSPGLVTAMILYIPTGVYFLVKWGRKGLLNARNLAASFALGGLLVMLLPTFARSFFLQGQLARVFGLVS